MSGLRDIWWAFWFCLLLGTLSKTHEEMTFLLNTRHQRHLIAQQISLLERERQSLVRKIWYLQSPSGERFLFKIRQEPPKGERLIAGTAIGIRGTADIKALIPGGPQEWGALSLKSQSEKPSSRLLQLGPNFSP
ncbi:MAG: hypothetical protein NZ959_05480 [Armatimonadetes bacterium]|nr:hypothetical protein [Armatimonadota bacterium]MDW8122069.1 hypothetical protein [Armatimonadota bacterium]